MLRMNKKIILEFGIKNFKLIGIIFLRKIIEVEILIFIYLSYFILSINYNIYII